MNTFKKYWFITLPIAIFGAIYLKNSIKTYYDAKDAKLQSGSFVDLSKVALANAKT